MAAKLMATKLMATHTIVCVYIYVYMCNKQRPTI